MPSLNSMARPTTNDLLAKLHGRMRDWTPMHPQTVSNPLNEPPCTLPTLSADMILSAMSSAEQGDTTQFFAVARDAVLSDSHLQSLISTRLMAVLGDDPAILAADAKRPADVAAADAIRDAIGRLPDFKRGLCMPLLWGHIWPCSVVERTYKPATTPGLVYDWGAIRHVPHHLLRWQEGLMEIAAVDPVTRLPTGAWQRPGAAYVTHRGHLLPTPDNWGGPIRCLVWWFFFKTLVREWWIRWLDRYGSPFPVAKVPKEDSKSRDMLERALRMGTRIGGLVVSTATQIELAQANSGSADAHQRAFDAINSELSRAVLGQESSSMAKPTGLGSGVSESQSQVRSDIRAHDASCLAETLRSQFFAPWLRLNGFSGQPPKIVFGQESEEMSDTADVLAKLKEAGISLAPAAVTTLSERFGLQLQIDPATSSPPGRMLSLAAGGGLDVRRVILDADSPDEALINLAAAFPQLTPASAVRMIEEAALGGAWGAL
jgi:phage gp29-like protein